MSNDVLGPYIVWVDYGYEGWSPTSFATKQEVLHHLLQGSSYGPAIVTRVLKMSLSIEDED